MLNGRQTLSLAATFVFAGVLCSAQNIVSAHSGTIHYFDGDVTVDGKALVSQVARFSELKEQSVLHTGMGRAELLLTPGVYLRVGENSSIRMLDNRLMSTRVELVSGTAMVESDDPGVSVKDAAVTIIYKGFEVQPVRLGVFEVQSDPAQVKAFKGEARVSGNGASVTVREANRVDLSLTMATSKFDNKVADDLYLWTRDRSAYLSAGSMASARSLTANAWQWGNANWNPSAWNNFSGGWYYNRMLGIYTFLPFSSNIYNNPFGYGIYNPGNLAYYYEPTYTWGGSGGARTSAAASIPLTKVYTSAAISNSSRPQNLPRLGLTASTHPTISSPLAGNESVRQMSMPPLMNNNNNLFGAGSSAAASSVSAPLSAPSYSPAPAASAPAMAAAPAASAAPAAAVHR